MEKSTNILLDSTTYFRLAFYLHPLLDTPFGKHNYKLYVHDDLETEYKRNIRLQIKFNWVLQRKYVENRRETLILNKDQKKEAEEILEHLKGVKEDNNYGTQGYDLKCLAKAITLDIPVVTDDRDFLKLANCFNARKMSTVKLLSKMAAEKFITNDKVVGIVKQWIVKDDFPKNRIKEFNTLFRMDYNEIVKYGYIVEKDN